MITGNMIQVYIQQVPKLLIGIYQLVILRLLHILKEEQVEHLSKLEVIPIRIDYYSDIPVLIIISIYIVALLNIQMVVETILTIHLKS